MKNKKKQNKQFMILSIFTLSMILLSIGILYNYFGESKINITPLKTEKIELTLGETYQLQTRYVNSSGERESLLYSSSNPEVVEVDETTGYITVKGVGYAKISVIIASSSSVYRMYEIMVDDYSEKTDKPSSTDSKTDSKTDKPSSKDSKEPSSPQTEDKVISVTSVSINKTSTTLNVGSSEKLSAIISPKNATNQAVTWKSSDTSIATVASDGTVKGLKEGTATITVTTKDGGKKESIKVKVVVPTIPVTSVKLNKTNFNMSIGYSEKLIATITPSNATNQAVTWKSSDSNIVFVDSNGTVIAKQEGSATITVTTNDGSKTATANIKVEPIHVTGVSLNKTNVTISIDSTEKLVASVSPSNATNQSVIWQSNDIGIVSVSNDGTIKGLNEGTATITVTTKDGYRSAKATVKVEPIHVTGVSLNKTNVTMAIGSTDKLVATVSPSNATNKAVTWASSNNSIVTVDANGNIKGLKEGSATVTVTTNDGFKTAKATVKVNPISVIGVSLNVSSANIAIGSSEKLIATVTPSNATNQGISWKSSDTSVATVSNDGTVKGLKEGTATITVTTNDGSKTAKATIKVVAVAVTGVTLNKTSETMYTNSSNLTTNLIATISPSNATNKTVTWQSSDPSVATVNSEGTVTGLKEGTAVISATAGGKTATYTLTIKQKIIIVIGASQVTRMNTWVSTYNSSTMHYAVSNNTLKIINSSGTGFAYQTGSGWNSAKSFMSKYDSKKDYIEFYIYFPMPGNDIKGFTCSQITTSNTTIQGYMQNFNKVIQAAKNSYQVNAYVVSVQPVKPGQASSSAVVTNTNSNACKKSYRSNVKYYTFNKVSKALLDNYNDLTYVETFTKIMEVNETGASYSYKVTYNTTDGFHWDKATTLNYMKWMLEDNPNL